VAERAQAMSRSSPVIYLFTCSEPVLSSSRLFELTNQENWEHPGAGEPAQNEWTDGRTDGRTARGSQANQPGVCPWASTGLCIAVVLSRE